MSSFYAVPSFQTDLDHDDENISSSVNFRSAQYEPGSRSKESRLPCDRIPFFSLEHNFLFGTLNLSTGVPGYLSTFTLEYLSAWL